MAVPGRIVLAREPPFTLGTVHVDPPTRQVTLGERSETLEPRVMQVLVALARAGGTIVTRDDLSDRCWDGRIVGDDSINRAMSRIRRLGAGLAAGSFTVETITKVGYRLKLADQPGKPATRPAPAVAAPAPALLTRRPLLLGGGAIALAAAGGGLWLAGRTGNRPTAEARDFFVRGVEAQRQATAAQDIQAVASFENAVKADPDYADAWGALALAYWHLQYVKPDNEAEHLDQRRESAARRALALDPDNADAQVALAMRPLYRNWLASERSLRALLRRLPDHPLVPIVLSRILYDVGRIGEGVEASRVALGIDPWQPRAVEKYGFGLWASNRLNEAEDLLDEAARQWPSNASLWLMRFNIAAYSGKAGEAAAMAAQAASSPVGIPDYVVDGSLAVADALQTRDPARIRSAAESAFTGPVEQAAFFLAAIGDVDRAMFRVIRYLSTESWPGGRRPIGPRAIRKTSFLFAPATAALRHDARFADVIGTAGLDEYWRRSGTRPDYANRGQ